MTDYLREVEQSMRAEKFAKLWNDHKTTFIMVCAAIILGVSGQTAWDAYKLSKNEQATAGFMDAMQAADQIAALTKLGSEKNNDGAVIANLYAGNLYLKQNEMTKALNSYQLVIDDKRANPTYRDLAIIQKISIQIDHDKKITADELLNTLKPLMDKNKSTWYNRALLLNAIIKADKQNDYKGAIADLKNILNDKTLPENFVAQVSALQKVYTIKGDVK